MYICSLYLWDRCFKIINYVNTLITSEFCSVLHLVLYPVSRVPPPPPLFQLVHRIFWSTFTLCRSIEHLAHSLLPLPEPLCIPSGNGNKDICLLDKPDQSFLAWGEGEPSTRHSPGFDSSKLKPTVFRVLCLLTAGSPRPPLFSLASVSALHSFPSGA